MRKPFSCVFVLSILAVISALNITGCTFGKNKNTDTITVWHWMTDRHDALVELAQKYERETGIKVNFELYAPSDAYSQKVIAAAQAKVLPDIFGVLGEKKVFASFIENGFVADLTNDFRLNNSEWESSFFPKALAVNQFEESNIYKIRPGIYGVPIDVTTIQMLYNKKLLKQAGITNPPETFQELIEDIEALKRVGLAGFVSGWGEAWLIDCFASNYAFNVMGEEKVMATYRGKVKYTDADWITVFNLFKILADHDAFVKGIVIKGNKYAEQDFALERAAFAFNGSWCVNVYKDMNPNLEYGVMLPPAVSKNFPMAIWYTGSSFVVNGGSMNKQKSIDFLKWLTAREQQAVFAAETKNLPANKKALSAVDPILSGFAKGADYGTHPTAWRVNEHPKVSERFTKGIQSIIIGEKTPQEVAQEVQAAKEKVLERESRRKN
ncbi:MAG TPA: extracellular solute-binding protein [Candidatus Omnitrophota bacterium]|nr:extracellular solute-binding protein [Candidatus Omnitrophota bacterium]HPD84641.1 extracellular solute-binding protein [Candidatus Omnitrophota bacterium]HRZ03499.1 extracellular solute-binding protein [Candidatus Omnitrophota bacterium]